MLIELHAIQNFAPSNLNRDDTGAPKSCTVGGVPRARISSQSFKRAMRTYCRDHGLLDEETEIGVRTRQLPTEIGKQLVKRNDMKRDDAVKIAKEILTQGGITSKQGDDTDILMFLSPAAISRLVAAIADDLPQLQHKDSRGETVSKDAYARVATMLVESAQIPHIALFGRMIEVKNNTPFGKENLGAEGAAQMSHPFSTHEVRNEVDYFTAVDDLNENDPAAAMIGMMEFNSACYYRYANLDIAALRKNLNGDDALVRRTTNAFIRAFQHAVPVGKQRSFAPQSPPSFTLGVVRASGAWSLANAFVRPVTPRENGGNDLITNSIVRLDRYWHDLTAVYPDETKLVACVTPESAGYPNLAKTRLPTFAGFVEHLLAAAFSADTP